MHMIADLSFYFQIHIKRFPATPSYKLLVSLCRLSSLIDKPLQVSEVLNTRPSGNDISSGQRRDISAIMEGRPAWSITCQPMCLCTGAHFEHWYFAGYYCSLKFMRTRTEALRVRVSRPYFLTHKAIFIFLSWVLSQFSTAELCSLLYCSSSQAPHKIHTSRTSTAGCLSPDLWALHQYVCVCICVTVMNELCLSVFTPIALPSLTMILDLNSHQPNCPIPLILVTIL